MNTTEVTMEFEWTMERVTKLLFHATLELGTHSIEWAEKEYEGENGCPFAETIRVLLSLDSSAPTLEEVEAKINQMWPAVIALRDELLMSRSDVVDFYGVSRIMKHLTVGQTQELEQLYADLGREVVQFTEKKSKEEYPAESKETRVRINSLGSIRFAHPVPLSFSEVANFLSGVPFSADPDVKLPVLSVGRVYFKVRASLYPGEIRSLLALSEVPPTRQFSSVFEVGRIDDKDGSRGVTFQSSKLTIREIRFILFGSS